MRDEFVIRGQTASGETETLNFSGHKSGMAYRLMEFELYPSTSIHSQDYEMVGSITAGKTAVAPTDPNFNDEGLIGTAMVADDDSQAYPVSHLSIVNDTFLITQDLILKVFNTGSGEPVNWHCRFKPVKMSAAEEAVTNYKQFTISDE